MKVFISAASLGLAVSALPLTTFATPISYSVVSINSQTSVNSADPDFIRDHSGAAIELSEAGSQTYAYSNGSGGYTFKPTSDDVFARSSLSTGELKTRAMLEFGASYGDPMPIGHRNGSARARAIFADSFSAYNNTSPFFWSDDETVNFNFAVTGNSTIPDGLQAPQGFGAGEPKNAFGSSLSLTVYNSGGLDLVQQLNALYESFDYDAYDSFEEADAAFEAQAQALENQIQVIDRGTWFLGDYVMNSEFESYYSPDQFVDVNSDTPTDISFSFMPDGDFDWILDLSSFIRLDASLENVMAMSDFSHTVLTSYSGPTGATTYSASGLFPNTLSLGNTPSSAVPEPSSLALISLGMLGFGFTAMRRKKQA